MEKQDLALWIVTIPKPGCALQWSSTPGGQGYLEPDTARPSEDVEECMADVFVALWKNARRLCQSGAPVKAWLVVTARNTGINRLRPAAPRSRRAAGRKHGRRRAAARRGTQRRRNPRLRAGRRFAQPRPRDIPAQILPVGVYPADRGALGMSEGSVNTRLTAGGSACAASWKRRSPHP